MVAVPLHPLQKIVNVHWKGGLQILIGMPNSSFGAIPETMSTQGGKEFNTTQYGPATFSGASGLGKTVIGKDYNMVAFGKPEEGPECFIVVDGNWFSGTNNSIRRGALNDDGELEWSAVGTFPSFANRSAYSCSYAGEKFFIQYATTKDDANIVGMAVSSDGTTWAQVNPFPGVEASSICNPDGVNSTPDPSARGGSVAYDKNNNRYVTIGSFVRAYKHKYIFHGFEDSVNTTNGFDRNFMSSVSSDGLTWTSKFDKSEGRGTDNSTDSSHDIGHDSAGASTVCFSKALGLFVAPSIYKKKDQNLNNAPDGANTQEYPLYIEASGIATSTDGVSWTNHAVGAPSTLRYGVGSQYSFSYCVTFLETSSADTAPGSDGFFLLGVNGGTDIVGSPPARAPNEMWRSEDGINWTQTRTSDIAFPQAMTQINKHVGGEVVYI